MIAPVVSPRTPGLPGVPFFALPALLAALLLALPVSAAAALPAAGSAEVAQPEATPAPRREVSPALDRLSLSAGAFLARSDTTISASTSFEGRQAAGRFNLERDLGLDDGRPVAHARLEALVGESQGFALEVYGFERRNGLSLARDIEYDGRLYEARAAVQGGLDYRFASAAWRWWLGEGDQVVGIGLGLAHYRVQSFLAGEASLDGERVAARTESDDAALAPLLALGWRRAVSPGVRLYADLSGVAKDGGPLQGHILHAAVGLDWFPTRHLGLAAEYGGTHIRLDRQRDLLDARLDLKLRGPSLFLRLR